MGLCIVVSMLVMGMVPVCYDSVSLWLEGCQAGRLTPVLYHCPACPCAQDRPTLRTSGGIGTDSAVHV